MKTFNKIIITSILLTWLASFSMGQQKPSEHPYIDLGLPSGTLWATCNVGANSPEEYGDYFAWGETTTKTSYSWRTYKYSYGDYVKITKYCNLSSYGYDGFTDNLKILEDNDDTAMANWGIEWCMPTADQWKELFQNTENIWTTQNGVIGRLFIAKNGNSLFLPAAGGRKDDKLNGVGVVGVYWSSSLYTDYPGGCAYFFCFFSNLYEMGYDPRNCGHSVRPVRSGKTLTPDDETLAANDEILIPNNDTLTPNDETLTLNDTLISDSEPLQTASPPAPDTSKKVYASSYDGFVNIRKGPNKNATVLGVLRNGPEGALFLGVENGWTKINYKGIVGYVYSKYVQDTPAKKKNKNKSKTSKR